MSIQQLTKPTSANSQQTSAVGTANLFLFDLKNEATEHGFKADQAWALQLSTVAEIAALKRLYHPLVTVRIDPAAMLQAYRLVKARLQQPLTDADDALTEAAIVRDELTHLAAFSLKPGQK